MHEAAIAEELLNVILEQAKSNNGRVVAINISCGHFDAVNEDVLGFAFESIAAGTVCEGAKLKVEHKPLRAHCNKCDIDFEFDITKPVCSLCGGDDFGLLGDEPLVLDEIEFETE